MIVIELRSSGVQVKMKTGSCEVLGQQRVCKDYTNMYTMKNRSVKACLF